MRGCTPHIAAVLLLLSACNSGQDTAESVMGERTPVPQEATERVFPVGEVEFVDTLKVDDPLFYPDKVVVLSSGELLVADRGSHQAVRLDPDGEILARYGAGSGEGPGEHRYLQNVGVFPDGTVWTWDVMNLRINLFEPDGSFIRSSVPTTVVQAVTALSTDEFVGVVVMMPDPFVAFDLDGSVIRRWGWFVDEPLPNAMPYVGAPLPFDNESGFVYVPLFGSRLLAYGSEGNLLWNRTLIDPYEVPSVSDDGTGFSIDYDQENPTPQQFPMNAHGETIHTHLMDWRTDGGTYIDSYDAATGSYRRSLRIDRSWRCGPLFLAEQIFYLRCGTDIVRARVTEW